MKTRVLVVDDDRLVADTLSLIYNVNGYECEARYSAADGFQRAPAHAHGLRQQRRQGECTVPPHAPPPQAPQQALSPRRPPSRNSLAPPRN